MSDRWKKAWRYIAGPRGLTVIGIVVVCMLTVVLGVALPQRVQAASCATKGLTPDTQYNSGACVGQLPPNASGGAPITDYVVAVIDVAGSNGVAAPTDLSWSLNGINSTGFQMQPNTSKSNEYISQPAQTGQDGLKFTATLPCATGTGDKLTVTATSAASGESQTATFTACDIANNSSVAGNFVALKTLTFTKANGSGNSAQCSGGGSGWIVCPIVDLIVQTMEVFQNNFIKPYLAVPPLSFDANDPIFKLWDVMRNLANVIMVILFFIVIFSQATSIGVSRYGIKRMLPRLLTAAILANLSFYLLAFLIDTLNLFGAGVSQLITSVIQSAGSSGGAGGFELGVGSIFDIVVAGVAVFFTGGLGSPVITWILSLLGSAFLILLAAVAVLVIRQMLIIVIVIASPILLVLRAIEEA